MSLVRSLASYWRRNIHVLDHHGSHSHDLMHLSRLQWTAVVDQRRNCSGGEHSGSKSKMEISSKNVAQKKSFRTSTPPRSPFSWARWAFGSILALILPFWHNKWMTLSRIEGEVEMVADMVENAAEMVEKVATVTEKVSSQVADRLPEDGKLKNAALLVEHVAQETAEEAYLAKDIIHKVDELKNDVEMLLEPIMKTEKLVEREGHAK
ncbi:uncharacterized protein [Elaeis guineensis]|uniref:Uncharacterized protein LOC105041428 n=1 Tax=Elaeis guineensis var. tenera TaxID=51953 RepID=A0A6I9QX27_ELAGV|nr:uncharacterized protein LOC105041428 [Elaeis guineensis]